MPTPYRLHLDHDGISLHRGQGGEALLTTRLDAPDFDARLAEMREAVLAEPVTGPDAGTEGGTGGAPVEIVLPDSQILHTEVAASGLDDVADAARVRTGLVGATPYDLTELLWDWRPVGRVLRIAVVARETVEEAEHFATAHGFLPTAYLGGASGDAFPGLPRFDTAAGPAETEATEGDATADVMAAAAAAAGRAREHAGSGSADMPDAAMAEGTQEADVPSVEPAFADDTAHVSTEGAAPVSATEDAPPDRAEGLQEPLAEDRPEDEAQTETPGADTRPSRGPSPDAHSRPSRGPSPDAHSRPSPGPSPDPDAQTGPSAPEPAVAAPFISHRAARAETSPGGEPPAGALSPSDPADTPAPGPKRRGLSALRAPTGRSRPGPRAPTAEPTAPGKPAKGAAASRLAAPNPAPMSAPTADGPATGDTAPAPKLTTLAKASPPEDLPPPPARREIRRRSTGGVVPAPVGAAPTAETEMDEASSLTVFGARRAAPPRRGPRYLGLTLTFALLAVMGLVALWSLWFGEERPDPVANLPSAVQPAEGAPDEAGTLARAVPPPEDAPAPPSAAADGSGSRTVPAITPLPDAPEPATVDIARAPPVPVPVPAPAPPAAQAAAPDPAAGPAAPSPAPANAAEAEILLDAPAAPMAPGASDEPVLTTAALTPPGGATPTPIRLPDDRLPETARRDALPDMPDNPLPPGSFLGPDGLVVPLPEGALTPGGYVLYTGPPPIVPPARPEIDLPRSDPAALPEAQAPGDAPAEAAPDDDASLLREAPAPDPLVEARPLPRPADATVLAAALPGSTIADETQDEPADIAASDTTDPADEAGQASAPPEVDLAGAVDAQDPAPLDAAAVPDPALAGLRPRGRPAELEAEAAALLEEAARADAVAREEAAAAAAAAQAAQAQRAADIASASPLAVANAPEPRARPSNIAQLAARAQRSAPAEQERQAAARAAQTPEPAAAPPAAASTAALPPAPNAPIIRRSDRVQPAQPTSALVARQATQRSALRLNRVTLIGVYGSASQRRALVRLPSGRYEKVQVGDRLDGGVVSAISRDELQYTKSGRAVTIAMPSG